MLAKCTAAAFLQGELKKQGKKESQAKPARKPARSQTKPARKPARSQTKPARKPARSQTKPARSQAKPSQPGAKPNQPESQPGAKPNQPGAKPNQPESQPGAKPNQPESQPEAKPSQPEANQKKPARVSFEGVCLAETQLLGILPNRISRGLYFAASRLVEYKPFGKLPLKREVEVLVNFAEGAQTVSSFKFAGRGQQETWVGDLRTTLLVVLRLRSRVQQVLEDFSAVSQTVRICKFCERQRNTPVADLRTTLLKKPPAAPPARDTYLRNRGTPRIHACFQFRTPRGQQPKNGWCLFPVPRHKCLCFRASHSCPA